MISVTNNKSQVSVIDKFEANTPHTNIGSLGSTIIDRLKDWYK